MWESGGRNIKLGQAEFIDTDPPCGESRLAQFLRSVQSLFEWLDKTFVKRRPTEKELEIPGILCLGVDDGILRLRETTMLEWVGCAKPNPPRWKGPEDTTVTNPVRLKMVRGRPPV